MVTKRSWSCAFQISAGVLRSAIIAWHYWWHVERLSANIHAFGGLRGLKLDAVHSCLQVSNADVLKLLNREVHKRRDSIVCNQAQVGWRDSIVCKQAQVGCCSNEIACLAQRNIPSLPFPKLGCLIRPSARVHGRKYLSQMSLE